jgi:hypothetical protein
MLRILASCVIVGLATAEHNDMEHPIISTDGDNVKFELPAGKTAAFERDGTQEMNLDENIAAAATNTANSAALTATLNILTATAATMDLDINATEAAIAGVVEMKGNVTTISQTLDDVEALYSSEIRSTQKQFLEDLDVSQDDSDDMIEATLKEITDELKRVQTDLDKNVKAAIADAVEATDALVVRNAAQVELLDAHEKCAETFQLYDAGSNKCVDAEVPQEKFMNRVSYRVFSNEDGRDGGYVDNRYLEVSKKIDDSYLRVFYQDNIRLHGHDTHCRWNVMFCDGGGNGCAKCADPGQIMHAKRHIQQHGWWTNDYVGGGVSGICKRSEGGALKAGKHQLKIYLDWNRYDLSTGSNGGGNFMVDEVMKY